MADTKKIIKVRNMMYTQQLRHLSEGQTVEDLYKIVDEKLNPTKWAGVVHDKDLKADGSPAEPQVHIMMQFKNARSIKQVAKEIGDKPQYIEKWDDRPMNGFAYLIHATAGARHLHQYSADEVVANFDYITAIKKVTEKYEKAIAPPAVGKIDMLLDKIATGDIPLKDAKDLLTGSEYAKAYKKLDVAHSLFLERRSEALHETMLRENRIVEVNWLYGDTETGKSMLAEDWASKAGEYYKTTTLKDPFQFYQAEPIIILDELRPDVLPYSELLAMFDPFSRSRVTISSRYFNKALSCHTFFVTTPYSPEDFYKRAVPQQDCRVDKPEQFYRRLSSILHMKMATIEKYEYDSSRNLFEVTDKKPNRYSKGNHTIITVPHLFDEID